MQQLTGRKRKIFVFLFPLAVVFPLVVVSFLIGVQSIWLWIGVGLGMIYLNRRLKRAEKHFPTPDENPWAVRYIKNMEVKENEAKSI